MNEIIIVIITIIAIIAIMYIIYYTTTNKTKGAGSNDINDDIYNIPSKIDFSQTRFINKDPITRAIDFLNPKNEYISILSCDNISSFNMLCVNISNMNDDIMSGIRTITLDDYNKIKNKTNEIVELELRDSRIYCRVNEYLDDDSTNIHLDYSISHELLDCINDMQHLGFFINLNTLKFNELKCFKKRLIIIAKELYNIEIDENINNEDLIDWIIKHMPKTSNEFNIKFNTLIIE